MFSIIIGNIGLGLVIGILFSLLYVSFDASWKKALSVFLSCGVGGSGLIGLYLTCGIKEYKTIFLCIGIFSFSFLLAFILFIGFMCKIIKEKDSTNSIRIRDILLGQSKFIQKYYELRAKEIDNRLNIPLLERRAKEIEEQEKHCEAELLLLREERNLIEKMTENKLKIQLPASKNLTVTKEFLNILPAYVDTLASFIEGIKEETKLFIQKHDKMDLNDFKVFLTILSIQITEHLFYKGARDVRVHFRYYDKKRDGYIKLISYVGEKEYTRDLTFIPYKQANMITKSYECRRALIKSHNIEYDYVGNNSTIWEEYMTGTFYNIIHNQKPCLSFGISVKSRAKYINLLNFLNYCKFETYLQEIIEIIDEKYSIETILYGNHNI